MFNEIEDEQPVDINLTTIINVVFLLLIFFIVQGSVQKSDVLPVQAPLSKFGQALADEPIEIIITPTDLVINLELVDEQGLHDIIRDILQTDVNTEIMLKADANLPAERLVEVLQMVEKLGGKNIFLTTSSAY